MRKGLSPIFEPGLEDMMKRNIGRHRLAFETSYEKGLAEADVIFIAVGTPQKEDGHANLTYIEMSPNGLPNIFVKMRSS